MANTGCRQQPPRGALAFQSRLQSTACLGVPTASTHHCMTSPTALSALHSFAHPLPLSTAKQQRPLNAQARASEPLSCMAYEYSQPVLNCLVLLREPPSSSRPSGPCTAAPCRPPPPASHPPAEPPPPCKAAVQLPLAYYEYYYILHSCLSPTSTILSTPASRLLSTVHRSSACLSVSLTGWVGLMDSLGVGRTY